MLLPLLKKMNQDNKKKQKKHIRQKKAIKLNENPFVSQEPNYVARKIDIQHFRNYTEASVSFSPHLNIFLVAMPKEKQIFLRPSIF